MSGRVHAEAKAASKSSFTPVRTGVFSDSHRNQLVSQPHLIQAKLTISQPNDRYEQEADRVAEQVLRMPEPGVQIGSLRDVIGNIRRDGGTPSVERAMQLSGMPPAQRALMLSALQQTHGNRYVQRVVAGIQAKLVVGQPGDIHEHEADRVADEVLSRINAPHRQTAQRQELFVEEETQLQRKPFAREVRSVSGQQIPNGGGMTATPRIEASIQQARSRGQPIPDHVRETMEQAFGADFSGVRIHADTESDRLNRLFQARAFTTGHDIFFSQGAYNHRSEQGQELIAHELTHVVQQVVGEAGTRVIQRRVTCYVITESIDTRFLMLLTDEELQDQIAILEVERHSEHEEERTESTDIEQIRSENLYRLYEELEVRRTVSPTPPVTERQRGGLRVIQKLKGEISRAGEMSEVPPELIAAVIMHESQAAERRMGQMVEGLQASLLGETASIGIGQMQVRAAREMQRQFSSLPTGEPVEHLLNERRAVQFVAAYLSSLMADIEDFLSGEGVIPNTDQLTNLTAIAYNMGWENLRDRNLNDPGFGNTMAERVEHILGQNRYITLTTHYIPWIRGQVHFKLINGSPNDKYENEADRVADAVMRMPEPPVQRQLEEEENEELVQPKLKTTPEHCIQRREEEEEEILLSKKRGDTTPEVTPDIESRIHAIQGGGQPLSESVRAFFESRFGYDFSQVRVHTGDKAVETARTVKAKAYTVGQDVVFGEGQYAPGTSEGRRLLAHELTHTIQQAGMQQTTDKLDITPSEGITEQEAEITATSIINGHSHNIVLNEQKQISRQGPHPAPAPGVFPPIPPPPPREAFSHSKSKFSELGPCAMFDLLGGLDELKREELDELRRHAAEAAPYGQERLELAMDVVWYKKFDCAALQNFRTLLQSRMDQVIPSLSHSDQQNDILTFLSIPAAGVGQVATPTAQAVGGGAGALETFDYQLSSDYVTVVKGEAEIKETPAYYAEEILKMAGIDPKAWYSSFTKITFLGQNVGAIHTDLAAHLKAVEKKLAATHGGDKQDPKVAGHNLGLNEPILGARRAPTGAAFSMHLFGLAIDVNYKSNPWISASANKVFRRAGLLVAGEKMQFKHNMPYADLKALDATLETYFSYLDQSGALNDRLDAARGADVTNFWSGKSDIDAVEQINQDLESVATRWERKSSKDVIKKGGFLSLPEDLVTEMDLAWGASYGDIMHFDMRNKGNGAKIRNAIQRYKRKKKAEAEKKSKPT